ncbi:MAG: T9SS type A sorting domain-containing protein [Fibrobacteria bacterium]|nr:T9SS type A sorting domain-containing protein [Fibrobacteria bacterium]
MKKLISIWVVLFFTINLYSQISFTQIPQDKQLYARNVTSGLADIIFKGSVNKTDDNYTQITVTVYRNETKLGEPVSVALVYNGSAAPFSITQKIKAELANYKFEVHLVNASGSTLEKTVNEVVAGDAYIIQGQSNAEAQNKGGTRGDASSHESPFIRVFGTADAERESSQWFIAQGNGDKATDGNTGMWGIIFSRLIVDTYNIPVAIFNGAMGGANIDYFHRNDSEPEDLSTNYGRLLHRVKTTGLQNSIRGIFWYQGESNAIYTILNTEQYKAEFNRLYADWTTDYQGVEQYYLFQIRQGCGGDEPNIMRIKEAHRQLAEEIPGIEIMSTSNNPHTGDNCHYDYDPAQLRTANNIFRLVNRDLYGNVGEKNIKPPNIAWAEHSGTNQISLIMKSRGDSLIWVSGAKNDFRFEGTSAKVSSGTTWKNKVILTMSGNASSATGVSFYGHQNTEAPMVKTPKDVGAVHFYQFPITMPYTRDSANVKAILDSNGLKAMVSQVSEKDGTGRINKLLLSGKALSKIPDNIGGLDAVTTMQLDNNNITTLPADIIHTTPTTQLTLNNNRLCTLSSEIKAWVNTYAADKNWEANQDCSLGIEEIGERPSSFMSLMNGKVVNIMLPDGVSEAVMKIYNLKGVLIETFKISTGNQEAVWNIPSGLAGVYLVTLAWNKNVLVERAFFQSN